MRPPLRGIAILLLIQVASAGVALQAATYYVDSQDGDDRHPGASTAEAWRTLEQVNAKVFQPGDRLLLRAGTRYTGQLAPQASGALRDGQPVPILIGQYGKGPRPRIDAAGGYLDALLLRNVEFWEVGDLELTNLGTNRAPWRTGVRVVADGLGTMRHIHLHNLFVHDVNGDLRKDREGCGIYFESRGRGQAHFEDLLIESCHLRAVDRNGICQRTSNGTRSSQVVIRDNLLEEIGGDGIKLWGSNGGMVERNVIHGGRTRCEDAAAGIWPFDSDDSVIQFNEVSGMKGTKDGQGFDSDYRCRRSLFQYNYSHENEGGFFLICTPGNSYNEHTVIRYNISQNDGINSARVFHFGGGAKNTKVYNNTVYLGPRQDLPLVVFTDWNQGNAEGTQFFNNLFYVAGHSSFQWGKSTGTVFDHNVFFGRFSGLPSDPHGSTNQPAIAHPGSGADGRQSLDGYRLNRPTGASAGQVIPDNGGRDFFGQPVPADRPPCIGASEYAP